MTTEVIYYVPHKNVDSLGKFQEIFQETNHQNIYNERKRHSFILLFIPIHSFVFFPIHSFFTIRPSFFFFLFLSTPSFSSYPLLLTIPPLFFLSFPIHPFFFSPSTHSLLLHPSFFLLSYPHPPLLFLPINFSSLHHFYSSFSVYPFCSSSYPLLFTIPPSFLSFFSQSTPSFSPHPLLRYYSTHSFFYSSTHTPFPCSSSFRLSLL